MLCQQAKAFHDEHCAASYEEASASQSPSIVRHTRARPPTPCARSALHSPRVLDVALRKIFRDRLEGVVDAVGVHGGRLEVLQPVALGELLPPHPRLAEDAVLLIRLVRHQRACADTARAVRGRRSSGGAERGGGPRL